MVLLFNGLAEKTPSIIYHHGDACQVSLLGHIMNIKSICKTKGGYIIKHTLNTGL